MSRSRAIRMFPEQKIRIRKGEQGRLVFGLLPVPHMASLSIQGGPAGCDCLHRPNECWNRAARRHAHPLDRRSRRPRN